MPFTFSHPALVLPLKYLPTHWFSFTGLIIGSMVPDFEYFIRMRIQSTFSHTLTGLLWFDLPLGLLLAIIFHNIVKDRLIENMPKILKSRLEALRLFDWNSYFIKNWYIVIISILIGAASHIFWDSFTHNSGYFVQRIPWLSQQVEIPGLQIPVSNIIQHLSTLFGGLVIAFVIWKLPVSENIDLQIRAKYWIIFTLLMLIIVVLRFLTGLEIRQYGNVIVTVISASLISLTLTPLLMNKKLTGDNISNSQ